MEEILVAMVETSASLAAQQPALQVYALGIRDAVDTFQRVVDTHGVRRI